MPKSIKIKGKKKSLRRKKNSSRRKKSYRKSQKRKLIGGGSAVISRGEGVDVANLFNIDEYLKEKQINARDKPENLREMIEKTEILFDGKTKTLKEYLDDEGKEIWTPSVETRQEVLFSNTVYIKFYVISGENQEAEKAYYQIKKNGVRSQINPGVDPPSEEIDKFKDDNDGFIWNEGQLYAIKIVKENEEYKLESIGKFNTGFFIQESNWYHPI